jgi:hypothetical protein
LDDAFVKGLFSRAYGTLASIADYKARAMGTPLPRAIVTYLFTGLIGVLSIPVVRNLLAKRQMMNFSFDPLRLVNTYGAFGVVHEEREELIISSAVDVTGEWREYDFPVKPGNVMRRPRWISPYHYRLDWQLWIAALFGSVDRSPWMLVLLKKLLEADELTIKTLLANDPWHGEKPKYIRVDRYHYKFHQRKRGERREGPQPYWDREYRGRFYPKQGVATLLSLESATKLH